MRVLGKPFLIQRRDLSGHISKSRSKGNQIRIWRERERWQGKKNEEVNILIRSFKCQKIVVSHSTDERLTWLSVSDDFQARKTLPLERICDENGHRNIMLASKDSSRKIKKKIAHFTNLTTWEVIDELRALGELDWSPAPSNKIALSSSLTGSFPNSTKLISECLANLIISMSCG